MAYFKINGIDYSMYTSGLKVSKSTNYTSQVNAAGDMVVDYINNKRVIEVSIIPLTNLEMAQLQTELDKFNVSISFRNPNTDALEEDINCIIPDTEIEYYTIQVNKVMFNALTLTFTEL